MTALKLSGMRAAYDDILADGVKRRHPVQKIIAALLQVEIGRQDGALDQMSDGQRQAGDGQGTGGLRLRGLPRSTRP